MIPIDVLTEIFLLMIKMNMQKEVWSVIPLVCRRWHRARQTRKVKTALAGSPQTFDLMCKFQTLRQPIEDRISYLTALARIKGFPVPYLWETDHWLSPYGWRRLLSADSYDMMEKRLDNLQQCIDLVENPPSWAFVDTTEIPMPYTSHMSYMRGKANITSPVVCWQGLNILTALAIGQEKLLSQIEQYFVFGVSEENCGECNPTNWRKEKCKKCSRLDYLDDLDDSSCWSTRTQNWFSRSSPKDYRRDNVWYPPVELQCQKYVAELIDPIDGILRLSSNGLDELLNQSDEEALQQIRAVHTLATSTKSLQCSQRSIDDEFDLISERDDSIVSSSEGGDDWSSSSVSECDNSITDSEEEI